MKLSKNRKIFEKNGIYVLVSSFKILEIFSNKEKTYNILKELKIDKINFLSIKNKKKLLSFFSTKKNNLVLKPSISRGGRGIFIIQNIKKEKILNSGREIHLNFHTFKKKYLGNIKIFPQVVSEVFEQPVHDCDVLSVKGKLKKLILRKRIISEEPNSGHVFCKVPKDLTKKISKLSLKLNLNALHDVDLMLNKKGKFKILEVNPRPSGSVSVTCAAGINLFKDIIDVYYKKKIKKKIGIKNTNMQVFPHKSLISYNNKKN